MSQMIDVEVRFSGGVADGLLHPSRGEEGAAPRLWPMVNGTGWDIYTRDVSSDAPGVWAYAWDGRTVDADALAEVLAEVTP